MAVLAERQGGRCAYCQTPLTLDGDTDWRRNDGAATIDHVIPICAGGQKMISVKNPNLVAACARCNVRKGGMMPWEFVFLPWLRRRRRHMNLRARRAKCQSNP